MSDNASGHNTSYEWKAVLLLALGFGLVGLDRWLVSPLVPSIARDLHLSGQDVGNVFGVLALSWGVFAIVLGKLTDNFGRRVVLIPALLVFSLMCGVTGMVGAIGGLLLIRAVMGATEGAFIASSVAATSDASHPKRRGMNQGLMLSTFPLLGFGLGPILATQIEAYTGSWRNVFLVAAIPGVVIALLLFFVLREPSQLGRPPVEKPRGGLGGALIPVAIAAVATAGGFYVLQAKNIALIAAIFAVALVFVFALAVRTLKSRNILVGMTCLICAMSCVFVLGAFYPDYLQRYLHVSPVQAGLVMSAMGFGGCAGEIVICAASDFLGRKLTTVLCFVGAAISVFAMVSLGDGYHLAQLNGGLGADGAPIDLGAQFWPFYGVLFMVSVFTFGILGTITGPIATESVSPGLMASAVGIVSGTGEIFGAGVGPPIAGFVGDTYGIDKILLVGLVGVIAGTAVSLLLHETAPRKVGSPTT